ncbi:Secreted beta-glucosidase sun1, partial [Friedmanniomyces endolithicus]
MTAELFYLALTLVLALVQIFLPAGARVAEFGLKWNAGARDQTMASQRPLTGRLERAQANLFETLPLFIGAVLIAHVIGASSALSLWGTALYFWARLIYVPLYAAGVAYVRSLAWLVSLVGLVMAWGGANRFAGSKDRRAIADRVYKVLRARGRLSWIMGGREDGRALVIGSLHAIDGLTLEEIDALHSGDGYGPKPLSKQERSRITAGQGELPGWVSAGLPEFVVEDFKTVYGDDWTKQAHDLMAPRAPIDLRVNGAHATLEEVEAELREAGLEPERTPWSIWG